MTEHLSPLWTISLVFIAYGILLASLISVLVYQHIISWAIMIFAIYIFVLCLDFAKSNKKLKKREKN